MPRLTVDVADSLDKLLTDQAQAKGITKTELIRRAVASYATLNSELARGRRVTIADNEDRVLKEIVIP